MLPIIMSIILILFALIISFLTKWVFWLTWKYFFTIFALFFVLIITFPLWMFLWMEKENIFAEILYKIWAFFIWALFLTTLILLPILIISKIFSYPLSFNLKIITLVLIIAFNIYWVFNWVSTTVRNLTIKTKKETSIKWKKFILVADNHYWNIFWENSAKKFVEKVNSLKAEFVLIAWDLFDWPKIDFEKIAKVLWQINKPVYFAPGNHEEYWDEQSMLEVIKKNNINVLTNEVKDLDSVTIWWVTYSESKSKENFEKLLDLIPVSEKNFNILIKHEPTFQKEAWEKNYDLVVSWHTHNWQMWPFSLIARNIYGEFVYWLIERNGKYSITTSWIWNWWPLQRLWSRSEIMLIEVK